MKRIAILFLLASLFVFNGCEQNIRITDDMLNSENSGINAMLVHEALLQRNWSTYLTLFGISSGEFDMKDDGTITVTIKNGSSNIIHDGTWVSQNSPLQYTYTFKHNNPQWVKVFMFTPLSMNTQTRSGFRYALNVKYSAFYIGYDEPETGETVLYLR